MSDSDPLRDLLLSIDIADHIATFMPSEQRIAAGRAALEIIEALAGSGVKRPTTTGLIEAFGMITMIGCWRLRQRAGGRKLTNQAKRNRLAADVTMLRDAADRLEAVLLADGKVDHHAD